jgi:hypothetical protein
VWKLTAVECSDLRLVNEINLTSTPLDTLAWEMPWRRRISGDQALSTVRLERSGPSIRAVLAAVAPHDLVEFEAEFRCALAQADDDFDLARVQAVINRWWGRAHLRMHPPTAEERAAVARVAAGDDTGLHTKTAAGQWVEL